jgi:mannosyl-glycoprotein endo-beta-N-acetylglucosaminidase
VATPKPSSPAQAGTGAAVGAAAAATPPHANQQQLAFIAEILPYVLRESKRTGIPPEVFIVQSGRETGWGTSGWWRNAHNPAGIGVTGQPGAGNVYPDLSTAFRDYADKLMGHGEAGQEQFAADVKRGASAATLLGDLQASPWAASHYGGTLVDDFHALYGGGQGTGSTAGTGGSGGSGGVVGVVSSAITSAIPIIGGVLGAPIKAGEALLAIDKTILGIFTNWRYVVEVFAGIAMIGLGIVVILIDTGAAKKAAQVGVVAAMA